MRGAPALAVMLCLAAGCSRCGGGPPPPPERFVAATAEAVVLVPSLRSAAAQLAPLLATVLGFPAAASLGESWAAVGAQLGFDPLDPARLEEVGLDPRRGAAAALSSGAPPVLVLPLADLARFEALVLRLARERLGAGHRSQLTTSGASVAVYRLGAGQPPALSYAVVTGAVIVSPGPLGPEAVAAAASLAKAVSLEASATFGVAREALGAGHALVAWAPPASPALAEIPFLRNGAALALRGGAGRLGLQAAVVLPGERAEIWREVAGGAAAARAGLDEAALLPSDAALAARFGGSPAALGRRISYALPAHVTAALASAGVDLRRDLFGALAPGAALALSIAPTFDVAAVSSGALDLRAGDPFRLVHLAAAWRVADERLLRDLSGRLAAGGALLGAKVSAHALPGGLQGWVAERGPGRLAWAIQGQRLLVGGGAGRLEALLASAASAQSSAAPAARRGLEGGAAAAVVDFAQLVRSARALPPEAYGTGPNAFVMRSLADRFVEPAARLASASIRLDVLPGAARIDLEIQAREAPGAAP